MASRVPSAYHQGMAEITYLEATQSPPERGDWILLEQDPDGLFKTRSQRIKGNVTHLTSHADRWPLEQAIEKALIDAANNNIATIFVMRQAG